MIFSSVLALQTTALFSISVFAFPTTRDAPTYSLPGTLDANKYEIEDAKNAVLGAAQSIDNVLDGLNTTPSAPIMNVSMSAGPIIISGNQESFDGMPEIDEREARRSNCKRPFCPIVPWPPETHRRSGWNNSDSSANVDGSQETANSVSETDKREAHEAICKRPYCPPWVKPPRPYPRGGWNKSGRATNMYPGGSSSSHKMQKRNATSINDTAHPAAPSLATLDLLKSLQLINGTSGAETADNATRLATGELRENVNNMANAILAASWGVQGNLDDSVIQISDEEAFLVAKDISTTIGVIQAAVRTARKIKTDARPDITLPLTEEFEFLAYAIEQLWMPLNSYVAKIVSVNTTTASEQVENLIRVTRRGSERVTELLIILRKSAITWML